TVAQTGLNYEWQPQAITVGFIHYKRLDLVASHNHCVGNIQSSRQQPGVEPSLIKRGKRHIGGIDDLSVAIGRELYELMINVIGLMVLTMHIQQNTSPNL